MSMERQVKRPDTDPMHALKNLEVKFIEGIAAFEERFKNLSPQPNSSSKDSSTLTQLIQDFQQFKELMLQALGLLRVQLASVSQLVDNLDNNKRRKFLLFRGVPESSGEKVADIVADIAVSRLKISDFNNVKHIKSCYRLGKMQGDKKRPILVRFSDAEVRSHFWRNKRELKGSEITIAEFLTPVRRQLFREARSRCGVNSCWTKDGNIYVKLEDGGLRRLFSLSDLDELMPKAPPNTRPGLQIIEPATRRARRPVPKPKY